MDVERLERTLANRCSELVAFAEVLQAPDARPGLQQLLEATAQETIVSVRAPIEGLPTQWTAFWQFGAADEFGNYGPAGNKFGERTSFAVARKPACCWRTIRCIRFCPPAAYVGGDGDHARDVAHATF